MKLFIKQKEYLEIKLQNIVIILIILFVIYVFTTGWECDFSGKCANKEIWQGTARDAILKITGCLISFLIFISIVEDVNLTIKNPFYSKEDAEAWEEYQQWLKERKK